MNIDINETTIADLGNEAGRTRGNHIVIRTGVVRPDGERGVLEVTARIVSMNEATAESDDWIRVINDTREQSR